MSKAPQVSTIAPGSSFLHVMAREILNRFADDLEKDPLSLADVTILLPTRRAVRALGAAFLDEWAASRPAGGDRNALALPLIRPIGDVDEEALTVDSGFFLSGTQLSAEVAAFAPAVTNTRRVLTLARLIMAFDRQRSGLMPEPAAAVSLAKELANFLDLIETEEADIAGLANLVPERFAGHWQETLDFLEIITSAWPRILAEAGLVDPARRRRLLLDAYAAGLEKNPPHAPVIAAGSTGSIPATARLLSVIARLPKGEIVLPGLDQNLDEESWQGSGPDHPQYGLKQLLQMLGVERADVRSFGASSENKTNEARVFLLREALRPPQTTPLWMTLKERFSGQVEHARQGFKRIDAPSEREEAGIIALIMREALETPGRTAALVTPDRNLARRVGAALARFDLIVDDSAGTPLSRTPPGVFLNLIAELGARGLTPVPLLAVLAHPLSALGLSIAEARNQARLLEKYLLRGVRPEESFSGLRAALKAKTDDDIAKVRGVLEAFISKLENALSPFFKLLSEGADLPALLSAHIRAAEALAASQGQDGASRLWAGDAGEMAADFIRELIGEGSALAPDMPLGGEQYAALIAQLMNGHVVRPRYRQHPRLAIWGLLEARLQCADVLILGGLNEGSWPAEAELGSWLSRPMRNVLGLSAPERRLGLMAHDFSQAASAPEVVMTRALKEGGTPTVASRWLLRLEAVMRAASAKGEHLFDGHEHDEFHAWHESLDAAKLSEPERAPRPTPPVSARPRTLSATHIEKLIRNPYAIYARYVLGLRALDPLDARPDARHRGIAIHRIIERFQRQMDVGPLPASAFEDLLRLGEEVFAQLPQTIAVKSIWWPRFAETARWFIAFERERRKTAVTLGTEIRGELVIDAPAGPFKLTAIADRIDRLHDSTYAILDYKTGAVPTTSQVISGFSPQLPLEAAIAEAGGFTDMPPAKVSVLGYVHLSASQTGHRFRELKKIGETIALAPSALQRLIAVYDDPNHPYLSKPRVKFRDDPDDYDHLARVRAWASQAGTEEDGEPATEGGEE